MKFLIQLILLFTLMKYIIATQQGNSCTIPINMGNRYGFVITAIKCPSGFLCINFNEEGEPHSDCCGNAICN